MLKWWTVAHLGKTSRREARQLGRLIAHAAAPPEPFHFLQGDDVGVAHGFGDALKVDPPVEAPGEANIVGDDTHEARVRNVRRRSSGRSRNGRPGCGRASR
jgi:hypothetical protein